MSNHWIAAVASPSKSETPVPHASTVPAVTGTAEPQRGIPVPDAADRLARRHVTGSAALWIVGVHGGAGESTLASLIDGSRATQHAWPVLKDPILAPRVLLVCRSNLTGLQAARRALIEWTSSQSPDIRLLGLAALADAPGKLPKPLRELAAIIGGGAPRLWHLPWVEAWRTGDTDTDQLPRETRTFITDINSLLH